MYILLPSIKKILKLNASILGVYSLFDTIHTLDSQSLLQMMEKSDFERAGRLDGCRWEAREAGLGRLKATETSTLSFCSESLMLMFLDYSV